MKKLIVTFEVPPFIRYVRVAAVNTSTNVIVWEKWYRTTKQRRREITIPNLYSEPHRLCFYDCECMYAVGTLQLEQFIQINNNDEKKATTKIRRTTFENTNVGRQVNEGATRRKSNGKI